MTLTNYTFERLPNLSKDEPNAGDHTAAIRRSLGALSLREHDGGSCETFTKSPHPTPCHSQHKIPQEHSSLELAADQSHLDANVDEWLAMSTDTGVQNRVPTVQRSTLTPGLGSFFNMARVWCVLALAAPFFGFQPHWAFRCTSSMLFNSAEMMIMNMSVIMERARAQVTRLARQEITRDCFANAMDVILIIYAIGFMVISIYEAAAIC